MTLPNPIADSQVDAKSPIDEDLMQSIKANEEDLDSRISLNTAQDYPWKIEGALEAMGGGYITTPQRKIGGMLRSRGVTLQTAKLLLKDGGTGGTCEIDVRRYTQPNALITGIDELFSGAIQSIARAGSSLSTQSITRAASQLATQSIARYKTTKNIQSIVVLGDGYVRYNLDAPADADYLSAAILIASATTGANNGTFFPVRINEDGGNNIVIFNASGVAQTSAAGTIESELWKFTFTGSVPSDFTVGEYALFASHTAGANNGTFQIVAVNQSGNNLIAWISGGQAQAGVAGTVDVQRFKYNFASAVSTTDYAIGDYVLAASHTSGLNDGALYVVGVNVGGNNLVVANFLGTTQGGAAGTIDTYRWVLALSSDPSANVSAGDYVNCKDTTSAANKGTAFLVREVKRGGTNNIVITNPSGVAQGGAVGTVLTSKRKIKFASDLSAAITTASRITVEGTYFYPTATDLDVVEVNRGGGSNYNAVVVIHSIRTQAGAAGRVTWEGKSIFSTRPSIVIDPQSLNFDDTAGRESSNEILDATQKIIPNGTILMLDILSIPNGKPRGLLVQLR